MQRYYHQKAIQILEANFVKTFENAGYNEEIVAKFSIQELLIFTLRNNWPPLKQQFFFFKVVLRKEQFKLSSYQQFWFIVIDIPFRVNPKRQNMIVVSWWSLK